MFFFLDLEVDWWHPEYRALSVMVVSCQAFVCLRLLLRLSGAFWQRDRTTTLFTCALTNVSVYRATEEAYLPCSLFVYTTVVVCSSPPTFHSVVKPPSLTAPA